MRSLKELYELLLERLMVCIGRGHRTYICNLIMCESDINFIDSNEIELLYEDFIKRKPNDKKYENFYKHDSFKGAYAWWHNSKESDEQRVLFLKQIIHEL